MSSERDAAREALTEQVLNATSLSEVLAAQQALRAWIAAYPEEGDWMRDGFEQLSHMEDAARERAKLPLHEQQRLAQRDHLIAEVQAAATLPTVTHAAQQVDAWLALYPADETMCAMRDQLAAMRGLLDCLPV